MVYVYPIKANKLKKQTNMKMKKFLLVGLLGVVTLCGLSSCDDDDDGGYVPFSYAVGDMVVKDGSEPYIQLDSKQTLFPSNGSRLPKTGNRELLFSRRSAGRI